MITWIVLGVIIFLGIVPYTVWCLIQARKRKPLPPPIRKEVEQ